MPHPSRKWLLVLPLVLAAALSWWKAPFLFGEHRSAALAAFDAGNSHLYRFQYAEAEDQYRLALQIEPGFAMAELQRAQARWRVSGHAAAETAFARAESLAIKGANACEALWITYRAAVFRGDDSSRAAAYRQLQAEFPTDPYTLEIGAERARTDGDLGAAIAGLESVLAARPDRVDILNRLGYLELERGDNERAVAHLKRYVFYAPDAANPHDSLGEIFLATGRYFESAQEYLAAIEIDPGFTSSILGATDALVITGQLQRAENLLRTAHDQLEVEGRLPRYHLSQTQILFAKEQWAQLDAEVDRRVREPEFDDAAAIGPTLWMRALQCIATTREGKATRAKAQLDSLASQTTTLRLALPEEAAAWRKVLELMESSVRATVAVRFGDKAIQRLAQLKSNIDTAGLQAHQLLPFRTLLAQALFDHGLYEESLLVTDSNLALHPAQPRSNLLAAQSLVELGQESNALARLSVCIATLQYADAGHPLMSAAQRLMDRLRPPSS
jgi:tetratricopeptide (TPR) repeat protein